MKRKLLLIMPNFFDYPQAICKELENMGYEVDCFDDRPSTNGDHAGGPETGGSGSGCQSRTHVLLSVFREVKSYTKQKDPGSFRAISALKGPGSYTIVFQQAVLWTERLQQRNARLGAGLAGGSVPDAGLHLADMGAAQ